MTEPSEDKVEQLRRAFERFTRRFKVAEAAAAADNALNALDAQTLVFIGDSPRCGTSDIALYLKIATTTASSAVNRLVKKGLVRRERPRDDLRAIALTATKNGHAVIDDHVVGYREACRKMLRSLNNREQTELIRLTEKIASDELE